QRLADRAALDRGRDGAAGGVAQLRRELDRDRHQTVTSSGAKWESNSSSDAPISVTSNEPRTASSVFRPSPVTIATTRSDGSMSPRPASFLSVAIVTAPAVFGE